MGVILCIEHILDERLYLLIEIKHFKVEPVFRCLDKISERKLLWVNTGTIGTAQSINTVALTL